MSVRIRALIAAFVFFFSACCGRISFVIFSGEYQVSSGYNSYKLLIDRQFSTLYDRNMLKLNNDKTTLVAVIKPDEKCLTELNLLFNQNEISEIISELSKGYPVVKDISRYERCNNILIEEKLSSADMNYALKSVTDNLLQEVSEKSISFAEDAKGRILSGNNEIVNDEGYPSKSGFQLSIDKAVQEIAEYETNIKPRCAIVVMDVTSHEILALSASDCNGINRCTSPAAVGSVFKLIVAACAVENNIDLNYYCNGQIQVGDTLFSCQNNIVHKEQNMKSALANSCNCYFIKLALELGSERLIKTARDFGFGSSFDLYNGFEMNSGNLPSQEDLLSKGQLALLGFGQGLLTASPLEVCNAICAIASKGMYTAPKIIIADIDENGNKSKTIQKDGKRIIRASTSNIICKYMRSVVENGTGKNADYNFQSAGKTSTAQTGKYVNGKEILNAWFAGFYPYNKPQYAIVIMVEAANSGAGDCCPIFRSMVEKLDKL